MAQFTVTIEPARDLESLAALWGDLEGRAEPTFFTSWLWVGAWLRALPKHLDLGLVVARHDGMVVGLAVLTLANSGRRTPFRPCTAHLHETGIPALDVATIAFVSRPRVASTRESAPRSLRRRRLIRESSDRGLARRERRSRA